MFLLNHSTNVWITFFLMNAVFWKIFRDLMEETNITPFAHIYCVCYSFNPRKTQQLCRTKNKENHIFQTEGPKGPSLSCAGAAQQSEHSRGVAWMVQTCRSRELFALPHKGKTWRLNPNPAPCVSPICSFDIWLVYSMNTSLPHMGIETPWSFTLDGRR